MQNQIRPRLPGYFGENGESLVILLGGGTKKRQPRDINYAIATWQDYKIRKK